MTTHSLMDLVADYVALRRSLGYDLSGPRWLLRDFARHAEAVGHRGPLTIDLAVRWARCTDARDPCHPARRLAVVRQFARHRAVFDPATEIPPAGLLGSPQTRKPPHIYSGEEIDALLLEATRSGSPHALRPRTLTTLLGLLAATGMRVSEVCRLTHPDVDLDAGLLVVRESKFRKSRLVPLHPTTTAALACYASARDAIRPRSEFFFRTDRAARITRTTVAAAFIGLRRSLGWTDVGRARLPRVHDLRHTFAVRRLLRWYEEGADLDRKVLALATYLGHTRVSHTYWYLSAVPELTALASQRFERFACRHEEQPS